MSNKVATASLGNTAGAIGILGVLSLTIVPLPALALDLFLTISLCISLLVFMIALFVDRPLDFSSFPSLLLLVTLFRLALNVATTRRILLHGGEGVESAGGVIAAFGNFAVGGNFVVGAVVFLILVIVNFIVITKGAERISEVAARFTLDSMPGKQMAIDADLGAGLINEAQARQRRKGVEQEADFYGSMDGASKFVRGDAVAGLMIVGINVLGGIIVGVLQHDQSIGEAVKTYTILSIGDGLVTQIPALLVSTGAALLTTRGAQSGDFAATLATQMLSRSRPIMIAGGALACLGLLPGMPHLAMFALAGGVIMLGRSASRFAEKIKVDEGTGSSPAAAHTGAPGTAAKANDPAAQRAELESLLPVDLLSLEVGLDLLPLVDAAKSGELLGRIAALRKQIALELGVLVPPVHVKDNLRLRPGAYRILVSGALVGQGELRAGRLLAIDPSGQATRGINGETVKEPTFGLNAKWIASSERGRAEAAGCTVVDPSAVAATHLTEIIKKHASELVGRKEAQELMEIAAKTSAKVVEELIPHLMNLGEVIKVLKALLNEGVSIRDLRTILEALADHAGQVKDPNELTELVRTRLARQITRMHAGDAQELRAMVLEPRMEELFRNGGRGSDPQALSRATAALEEAAKKAADRDENPVLVVAPDVRRAVAMVAARHVQGLSVLSYREIDPTIPFVTRAVVSAKEAA
jgi:flagellar biosynthesis protein FlhA